MKKNIFRIVFVGILIFISALLYNMKNKKKELIYAVHNMPQFERDKLERQINFFLKENPGVTIHLKEFRRNYAEIKAGINDQNKPIDIFLLPYAFIHIYADDSLILPLTKYHGIKNLTDKPLADVYSYLRRTPPYALLYNKDLLNFSNGKLPNTQENFRNILQGLAEVGMKSSFVVDNTLEEYSDDPVLSEIILKISARKDITFFNELIDEKIVVMAKSIGEKNRYEAFLKYKAAFIISSIEGIRYIESKNPALNFGSISFPEEDDDSDRLLKYNRYVIGKNSKHPDLAFKFIEFLNNQD